MLSIESICKGYAANYVKECSIENVDENTFASVSRDKIQQKNHKTHDDRKHGCPHPTRIVDNEVVDDTSPPR
jgi:hypothetical protein